MTSETSIWSSPPVSFGSFESSGPLASRSSISLLEDEVHVWRLTLNGPIERFLELLDAEEVARANRFYFERDRNRFVIARGFLRLLLGWYLGADPKQVEFAYGRWGKPELAGEFRDSRLRFNMSHSHEVALYALTLGREIGIDIEYARADFASDDIAQRFFSAFEVDALCGLPEYDRVAGFFRCWTRKEAYIKATGRGLSQALDAFDVTLGSGDVALLRNEDRTHERWQLADIAVGENYAGALAVEKPVSKIRYWNADETDSKRT